MIPFRNIKITTTFKKDTGAWLLIAVSGILLISGIFWHVFYYGSLITFLIAVIIKKDLLRAFYKSEGLCFMIRGWIFYCLCSIPITVGFINGFLKNIKQQFM